MCRCTCWKPLCKKKSVIAILWCSVWIVLVSSIIQASYCYYTRTYSLVKWVILFPLIVSLFEVMHFFYIFNLLLIDWMQIQSWIDSALNLWMHSHCDEHGFWVWQHALSNQHKTNSGGESMLDFGVRSRMCRLFWNVIKSFKIGIVWNFWSCVNMCILHSRSVVMVMLNRNQTHKCPSSLALV